MSLRGTEHNVKVPGTLTKEGWFFCRYFRRLDMAGAEDEMTRTAAEPNEPNAVLLNSRELRNDYGAGEDAFRRGRRVTFTGRTVSFGGYRVIGAGRAEVFRPTADGVEPGGRGLAFCKTNPIRLADRSEPKPSLRHADEAPNEPNGRVRRKAVVRLLSRAARKCARRHCDTPEWQGTAALSASLRLERPYFIGTGVNRVPETVR